MILSIIVAYARNKQGDYVIGKDNAIPWHDSKDLSRFKEHTMGHAVIMGRKTFESIGKLLRGRDNIILTRQENYEVSGAYVFNDLNLALEFAASRHSEGFIIGGQELYTQTIDKADRMYVTYMHDPNAQGDTFFPRWNPVYFKEIYSEKPEESAPAEFEILQRISTGKTSQTVEEIEESMNLDALAYYYAGAMF